MSKEKKRRVYDIIIGIILGLLAQVIYDLISGILVNSLPSNLKEAFAPITISLGGIVTVSILLLFTRYVVFKDLFEPEVENERELITINSVSFKDADVKEILLKRFEESFNQIRLIHGHQYKGITITTTAVSALLGVAQVFFQYSSEITLNTTTKLLWAFIAIMFTSIGLSTLIREREGFLQNTAIVSRIERLLNLHESYPQFKDKRLLPRAYGRAADSTFEDYISSNFWKKKSLFFIFIVLYSLLFIIEIIWLLWL